MFTYRKYRVPVRLTTEEESEILRLRDAQRQAYNWAVKRLKSGWSTGSEYDMQKLHTVERRTFPWMGEAPAAVQRAGIRDAFTAAKMSVRRGRGIGDGLKYRSRKRGGRGPLRCGLPPVVVGGRKIKLPRFGTVECRGPVLDKLLEHEPRSYEFVDMSQSKDGRNPRYVLYVSCRVRVPESWNSPASAAAAAAVAPPRRATKGIDRGVVEPTVVAALDPHGEAVDKTSYDTASPFRENRSWYQRRQRRMSNMNPRSGRFQRLRRRMRKRMQKVANRRTYAECVAAKHVCDDHAPHTIVFEGLRLGEMTRRGRGQYKKGLNREMRFVRHSVIEQRVRNRAELTGIRVITVDPGYTSQECARCRHVAKKSRVTRDMFKCVRCHYIQQADINAAMVIGRLGLPTVPDTVHEAGPPEVGMPFVRRELDARLNCFTEAVGGVNGRRDNQAPAHHLAKGMEKERRKVSKDGGPRRRQLT